MKEDRTVQQPPSQKQKGELDCAFIRAIPEVTGRVAQHLISNQSKIVDVIKPLVAKAQKLVDLQDSWAAFYRETLGLDIGDFQNAEFPEEFISSDHLVLHPSADKHCLYERLGRLREVEVPIAIEDELLHSNDASIRPQGADSISRTYNSTYLLKIASPLTAESKMNCTAEAVREFKDHVYDLREMMMYELRYGHKYQSYGAVPCCNSRPRGNDVAVYVFEKLNGVISIYTSQKDEKGTFVWPTLSKPLHFDMYGLAKKKASRSHLEECPPRPEGRMSI